METILEMLDIDKIFPGVKALDGCHLQIAKGEIHVLMGENGAGKSTLMKVLVGIHQPNKGEIFYNNQKVQFKNSKEAEEAGIGIIYQEFNLIPKLTVCENIFLGRQPTISGIVNWKQMRKQAQDLMDYLEADIDVHSPVEKLGIAQQQLVEIAKALSVKTKILIMDEPTAALTDKEIDKLFEIMGRLKAEGVSIIYISHRMEEIVRIGDRATVMRDGKYVDTLVMKNTSIDHIIKLMVGRDLAEQYPSEVHSPGDVVLRAENMRWKNMVKDVSFFIRAGEIVGFAGLMGAGRTETMRAIFGAEKKETGKVFIHDKPVRIRNPAEAIQLGIGFLTEDRKNQGLVLNMSVRNNITLTNLSGILNVLKLIDLQKESKIVTKLSQDLTVKTPSIEQAAKNLSGGNQQKVVLAKWLYRDCKILIFDEPTRGIDVGAKSEIYKLMNLLVARGVAIIMISSELPEIIGMSDRIYVMREGVITGEVNRKEATQDLIMNYAVGKKQDYTYDSLGGGK